MLIGGILIIMKNSHTKYFQVFLDSHPRKLIGIDKINDYFKSSI
jgi:hypothetical protein